MIKKFSSPKIKIWFEPMFLTGSFAVLSGAGHFDFAQYEPPLSGFSRGDFSYVVPSVGFEPTSLAAYAPQAYAYSSSATRASFISIRKPLWVFNYQGYIK